MQIGEFINVTTNFLLVSAAIYFAAVFPMQKLQEIVRKKNATSRVLGRGKLLRQILEVLSKKSQE